MARFRGERFVVNPETGEAECFAVDMSSGKAVQTRLEEASKRLTDHTATVLGKNKEVLFPKNP